MRDLLRPPQTVREHSPLFMRARERSPLFIRDATGSHTLEIELPCLPDSIPSWAAHVWVPSSYSEAQLSVVLELLRPHRLDRLSLDRTHPDATAVDLAPLGSFALITDLFVKGRTESVRPSNLSPLSALRQLQKLTLWCRFDQIEALETLTELRLLDLCSSDGDRVAPIDLTPLRKLHRLESLSVHDDLANLDVAAELPGLRELSLKFSNVADLRPLQLARRLRSLSLDCTQVVDLQPLAALTELRELSLEGTSVADLRPLQLCPNLEKLSLAYSKEPLDLRPIAACGKLAELDLARSRVTNLSSLAQLTSLRALSLADATVDEALDWCEKLEYFERPMEWFDAGVALGIDAMVALDAAAGSA